MLRVYQISRGNDLLFGTAPDANTAISLIELAKLKGGSGVSLHGKLGDREFSGEATFEEACEDIASLPTEVLFFANQCGGKVGWYDGQHEKCCGNCRA